ncbi:MAG: RNA-binding transcriptional accessory protein [Kosmotoga sp.]|uniref:Tex family protein n=1 Tax=Kosmotoga sp. TaxID=1955248 RepID=UPI001DE99521|nr:RNA-binding transcriptional accessory protein [Kosmotoga sp.]
MDFSYDIADKLKLPQWKVKNAIELLEDGKTIPFIARYRKEKTGELDEIQIREISDLLEHLKKLHERKQEIIRIVEERGKLTPELKNAFLGAKTLQELEDLYAPYKSKKKTRADLAKEKGLVPLAELLKTSYTRNEEVISTYIDMEKGVNSIEDAISGAKDIIAEEISINLLIRDKLREVVRKSGKFYSERGKAEDPKGIYRDYYEFSQPISQLVPHRILALFRGEREKVLKLGVEVSGDLLPVVLRVLNFDRKLAYYEELVEAAEDSLKRLLFPSIEREIRNELKEMAENRAITVFSKNLRNLLLQTPLGSKVVMGIDPGYRTGCKIAVIGKDGSMQYYDTIYPTPPKNEFMQAEMKVVEAVKLLKVEIIAIGNGTASRETELFVAETIRKNKLNCKYLIVSEAGASIYSASKVAIEEFPDLDVTTRGAISIARRVQDPLAEYVKIPPESIGVGMYQHDVNKTKLKKALDREVESAVNFAGVNLNTASKHLLKYISGLNEKSAENIVKYREEKGLFKKREELLKVRGIGSKAFEQAAGFCRILGGDNPLDSTTIHPESYQIAIAVLENIGMNPTDLVKCKEEFRDRLRNFNIQDFCEETDYNLITVRDVVEALKKPGLDPRDELPKPLLRDDVLTMEQLQPGMTLEGTVRNVVDFGAFVDIGVKQDGLIHRSKMGRKIRDPLEILSVGQIVKVKVLSVDLERSRIALELVSNEN